jgi:hypothetical protein
VHVVAPPAACGSVRLLGKGATRAALEAVGAEPGDGGPTVVGEGELDDAVGAELVWRLEAGETVLVLAQLPEAAQAYPGGVAIESLQTAWGSSVFHFTTNESPLSSLPRRAVLVGEDSTIHATSILRAFGDGPFPTRPVVIAYKSEPNPMTGNIVGAQRVGAGTMIVCQYRLAERAAAGDAAAAALLADLLAWAQRPDPSFQRRLSDAGDGRELLVYSFVERG